ncbi:hypothetical protein NEPAR06_0755 [Nematocida parisii]|uniref:Uncharacterized protein n=1 Tax=Nematocida parisii (strain ERTm3) TaxID=935791 RepID=I3EJ59_NEMP3|nr:uncharacterized protein NEPG_02494 [Nematocida parisii ERTm1]EIJ89256.1 hypothetical protein NEQG_00026 [Nematocida parisii ERTm3]KAI5125625.1 hypothetical protein NEPAR03_0153 [Nematocida parisii]EIJ92606.1 hypothetical protein NEPG_02494 [Nematocida parisii ERTm1]KAI5125753.1 hypothetical protein NEPAR08_0191 [Nematocida parisii]KAI5140214.1 hypothetical protein NEPAR04_0159 [Nematocida parisii]|eukprot:XP_013060321.1 hypothetical protein NEPG_02494 [Nematocida parisii ERTm1]
MKDFIAVIAPYKANCIFRREQVETGEVLKSECNKKELIVVATEESDIACNYALASTEAGSNQTVEINGNHLGIASIKYFKAKTLFKKDEQELAASERVRNSHELSLLFGSAAFSRTFKKRKQLNEISESVDSKGEMLINTQLSSGCVENNENIPGGTGGKEKNNKHSLIQPVFPEKNMDASYPNDLYTLESIFGFDPVVELKRNADQIKNNQINLGVVTAEVLGTNHVLYNTDEKTAAWALLFDCICKIIASVRKKKLSYIYETEDPIQVVMIKKLVKNFIGNIPVGILIQIDKKTKDRLLIRLIILILLKDNCIIDVQKYRQCFFGCSLDVLRQIFKEINCKNAKKIRMKVEENQNPNLVFVLTLDDLSK